MLFLDLTDLVDLDDLIDLVRFFPIPSYSLIVSAANFI